MVLDLNKQLLAGRAALESAFVELLMLSELPVIAVVGPPGSGKSLIMQECARAWDSVKYVDCTIHYEENSRRPLTDQSLFATDERILIIDEINVCDLQMLDEVVMHALANGGSVILTCQFAKDLVAANQVPNTVLTLTDIEG